MTNRMVKILAIALAAPVVLFAEKAYSQAAPSEASVLVFTGDGADNLWTNPDNWAEANNVVRTEAGGFFVNNIDGFEIGGPAGRIPDISLNDGFGESVILMSDVTVPSGVDFVAKDEYIFNDLFGIFTGERVYGNFFMVADGVTATIQSGARVGLQLRTDLITAGGAININVERGGEWVTGGIWRASGGNGATTDPSVFNVNVAQGGVMAYDALSPTFPNGGFADGNAGVEGIDQTFNVDGKLAVRRISNATALPNFEPFRYVLGEGGEIDMFGQPVGSPAGEVIGDDGSVGNTDRDTGSKPRSSVIDDGTITLAPGVSAIVSNIYRKPGFQHFGFIQDGLTVDISNQSNVGTDSNAWANYVTTELGGDPATIPGPMEFEMGTNPDISTFIGGGTVQFDVYGFNVGDTVQVFNDQIEGGAVADQVVDADGNSVTAIDFDGSFEIGYV